MSAEKTMGTVLKKTSGTQMTVAGLTSIGEFGIESGEIDVTTLDSPNGFKEFIAGLKDAGEISLQGFVKDETNVVTMQNLANAQTIESWEIDFPSGAKWTFDGFVKTFKEAEATVEGARGFSASIRISGAPTYTSAPSA